METKYGNLPDIQDKLYKTNLINKFYKILPLKERNSETIEMYIESLIYELYGADIVFNSKKDFITLISILEMIKSEKNHAVYKQKIFQCTNELIPSLFYKEG
jgi:hypothetical protein